MKKIYFRNRYCLYVEAKLFNGSENLGGDVKEKYLTESIVICNYIKWDIVIKQDDDCIVFVSNVNINRINDNSFDIEFKREDWEFNISYEFEKSYIRKKKIQLVLNSD